MNKAKRVFITGGAGYVGSILVPKLLNKGHYVKVIDLYIYGEDVLNSVKDNPKLIQIKGDIRNKELIEREIKGYDTVIHLACISNDPSCELNPALTREINYDAFIQLVDVAKNNKVERLIYASSSSVYGIKKEEEVTEDLPLEPLTDYSKYKAKCEEVLMNASKKGFVIVIVRPSTVCGYSPRMRLDLTVNILTNHAINKEEITVFGGEQMRPNIHIEDMTDLYVYLLGLADERIDRKIYNVGYENYKIKDIAKMVQETLGHQIPIKTLPTNDNRSYHISSRKIKEEIGFSPKYTVKEAIFDMKRAFEEGKIPNPMTDIKYYNVKTMKAIRLV
ncbi:MAG: SDR family oxidoreductase [bacterium]